MKLILNDLLKEFSEDKIHLNPGKNPQGYIYTAARRRAINVLQRKLRRYQDSDCGVENLEIYADEMGRSPAELIAWESRRRLLEDAFEELAKVLKANGHIRNPQKAVRILRGYLDGKSCKELAKEFHLADPNYPAVLKSRYLLTLREIIHNLEKRPGGSRLAA